MHGDTSTKIDRIDKKLSRLLKEATDKKPTETWVKASVITRLTSWDREKMRAARKYGYIKYRNDNGFWYMLESLNTQFIKK